MGSKANLCFDFDEKPRSKKNAQQALHTLVTELYRRGAQKAIQAQLPNRDKNTDALDDLRQLPRTIITQSVGILLVCNILELRRLDIKPREMILNPIRPNKAW